MGQGQLRQTTGDQVVLNYLSVDVLTNRQNVGASSLSASKLNKEALEVMSLIEGNQSTSISKMRASGASQSKDKMRRAASTKSAGKSASKQNRLKSSNRIGKQLSDISGSERIMGINQKCYVTKNQRERSTSQERGPYSTISSSYKSTEGTSNNSAGTMSGSSVNNDATEEMVKRWVSVIRANVPTIDLIEISAETIPNSS